MMLTQEKAIGLLKKYKMKTPRTLLFKQTEIKKIKINFPVALKVDSSEIIHKSDLGLVFTNIKTIHELNRHMKTISIVLKMHNIKKYNYVVQEMIKGQEIIMGIKRDNIFGPVILFGLGGVLVEILKDVSMRVAPLSKRDCNEMIDEIKGSKLLDGYRNIKKVNKEEIIDLLMKLSDLAIKEKQIEEIDFNPVIVNERAAIVVDARIIMKV